MANITTILASATDLIPEECSSELELQIFSNEDMNFPINLNLDVDQNSIEFEKLSSPIYDYEYSLNEEKLDIDLIASLKTEFDDFDEYESNNTQSTADSLSNGIAMIGSISSSSDIDYFCYTTPSTVPSGVVNLDISLSVPSNQRIKMEVSCAQNSYNISKTSAKGTGIHLRIENASLGSKYYIKISNFSGLTGGNYYLTVNQDIKDAWYGQFYSTLGSVDYWNPNGLDTVKF